MTTFPIFNPVKFTYSDVQIIDNYANQLYRELSRGVNQDRANEEAQEGIIFKKYEVLRFQIWTDAPTDLSVKLIVDGVVTNFGTFTTPINGAVSSFLNPIGGMSIYDFSFTNSNIGKAYIEIYDAREGETFTSETFYISEKWSDKDISNNILKIQYKCELGLEKGYYWGSYYQSIKLDLAHYSNFKYSNESEKAKGIKGNEEVLSSFDIRSETYTLYNLPEYLVEMITKATGCSNLRINDIEKVRDGDVDISSTRDGRADIEITFKDKNYKTNW